MDAALDAWHAGDAQAMERALRDEDPSLFDRNIVITFEPAVALDEEPDDGFSAAPGVAHRDQAAVGRGLVGSTRT